MRIGGSRFAAADRNLRALVDGSGGAGIHAGGMGTRKVIRSLVDDVEFSLLYERALNPAQGAADGAPGQAAAFAIKHADGSHTLSLRKRLPAS